MSDKLMSPVSDIKDHVMTISEHAGKLTEEETNRMVEEIHQRGGQMTALLNQLISESEDIIN
jgi:K+-sensing histidine kinase KdpD